MLFMTEEPQFHHIVLPSMWFYGQFLHPQYKSQYQQDKETYLAKNIEQTALATVFSADNDEILAWFERRQKLYQYPDYKLYQEHKVHIEFLTPKYPYTMIDREELTKRDWMEEFVTFFNVLALAQTNNTLRSWLLQQEVQLFLKRLCQDDPIIVLTYNKLMDWILGNAVDRNNNIYTFEWWMLIDFMEKQECYTLKNGKFVLNLNNHQEQTTFYKILHDSLFQIFDQIFSNFALPQAIRSSFQPIANDIQSYIAPQIDLTSTYEQVDTQILPFSAMCIRDLDNSIQNGSHIGHYYTLQLSFYMKSFLVQDDLKEYFYRHDAQNTQFTSKEEMCMKLPQINYYMEHQYKGGNKNAEGYAAISCKTCQSTYFRFYRQASDVVLKELTQVYAGLLTDIDTANLTKKILERIRGKIQENDLSYACSYEFLLRSLPFIKILFPQYLTLQPHEVFHKLSEYYRTKKSFISVSHPLGYYQNMIFMWQDIEKNQKK